MKRRLALLAPLALGVLGCPSFTTMGTARTIREGTTQFFVAPEVVYVKEYNIGGTGLEPSVTYMQFELGARHGVSESVEVGGKVWQLGFEIDTKLQLVRSQAESSGVDLAIDPGIGYLTFGSTNGGGNVSAIHLYLPLLVGFNLGGGSQLVVGPKGVGQFFAGGGSSGTVIWAGSSLGLALKIGRSFRLLPEVSVMYPVSVGGLSADLAFQGVAVQGGLGLLFGGD